MGMGQVEVEVGEQETAARVPARGRKLLPPLLPLPPPLLLLLLLQRPPPPPPTSKLLRPAAS